MQEDIHLVFNSLWFAAMRALAPIAVALALAASPAHATVVSHDLLTVGTNEAVVDLQFLLSNGQGTSFLAGHAYIEYDDVANELTLVNLGLDGTDAYIDIAGGFSSPCRSSTGRRGSTLCRRWVRPGR